MSLVESIGTTSVDFADPALVLCLGAVGILLALLMAPAALAAILNVLTFDAARIRFALNRLLGRRRERN